MLNRSLPRALLGLILVAGCKSSSETADAGPGDAANDSAGPCGDAAACATGQLCVSHQNCTNLACTPVPASGQCPAGTSETPCPDGGQPGCIATCAATFRCQPRPSGCTTVSCSCATVLCAPDTCIATMGDRVACGTQ